jgi:hypothetical protein
LRAVDLLEFLLGMSIAADSGGWTAGSGPEFRVAFLVMLHHRRVVMMSLR